MWTRTAATRLAGLFFAAVAAAAWVVPVPPAASQDLSLVPSSRIDTASAGTAAMLEAFDALTMALVDIDQDGSAEILAHNDNNRFYVFSGATGALVAELETNHPDPWGARELAGPAVGDIDGDGRIDVVLTNSAGWVTAFTTDAGGEGPALAKRWETLLDPHQQDPNYSQNMTYGTWEGHPGLDGHPFLADTDRDGHQEVFAQLDNMPSLYKLAADGTVLSWAMDSDGNAGPVVADLDGDGRLEAVFPSDGGELRVYDARLMHPLCTFSAAANGAWPGSLSTPPTLVDLDADGRLEMVFGSRNVSQDQADPDWINQSHALHFAVDAGCQVVWKNAWTWGNPHVYMSPVPVDVDGDGLGDLVFQDWNTVGHRPGNWERTGPANLYAIQGTTGDLLWRVETTTYWSNKNLAVADVTGDGQAEILVNEERAGRDGIGLYSLAGLPVGFVAGPEGWDVTRGPAVADLDGDGGLDIVLPVHRPAQGCRNESVDVGCREGALQLYRTSSSATPVYANSHRWVAPSATAGPPPGAFDAIFYTVAGTEWWVQARVGADRPLDAVEVRSNNGSWRPLELQSWGAWAASYALPNGSLVQLRAVDAAGDAVLSACYRWTSATKVPCEEGAPQAEPTPTEPSPTTSGPPSDVTTAPPTSPPPSSAVTEEAPPEPPPETTTISPSVTQPTSDDASALTTNSSAAATTTATDASTATEATATTQTPSTSEPPGTPASVEDGPPPAGTPGLSVAAVLGAIAMLAGAVVARRRRPGAGA